MERANVAKQIQVVPKYKKVFFGFPTSSLKGNPEEGLSEQQTAAAHLQDRLVEKHVSTMRRWELLPELRLLIARHMPDGPACKKCSCHLQTHRRPPRSRGAPTPPQFFWAVPKLRSGNQKNFFFLLPVTCSDLFRDIGPLQGFPVSHCETVREVKGKKEEAF